MSDVIITVRGEHEDRYTPEEGVVRVAVRAEGPERVAVVDEVTAHAAPIRTGLDHRHSAGAVSRWTSERITVWSDRPWNGEGQRSDLVHHASIQFTAIFADASELSSWIEEISTVDTVSVESVVWRLGSVAAARAESDAAARAVSVAVARAKAYAEALGLSSVSAVEVADSGMLSDAPATPSSPAALYGMRAMAADASSQGLALRPDDIVVSAAVDARFRAS
ncbi:hypothetical protein FHX49_000260 [Microbacterium endophyticum]|uniref:SIMPL domain-containing protein n=1 Tax=Microbacterium endophyticum TaxID=1526412 RepID=A0A7W4V1B4_9MICO|nr:SIMPL domain-containing protein [Microbacterium endophyticum]MBB2974719.1 hypothetical protein [Microbacterium endophyticum]NIK37016.1 hypothetical protein [Microbacterium endophyticum]